MCTNQPRRPRTHARAENQPQINALPVKRGSVLLTNLVAPFPNCRVVYFQTPFSGADANIIVTTSISHASCCNEGVTSWTAQVTAASFTVCVRELNIYDGAHPDLILNYLAAARNSSALAVATSVPQSALWNSERGSQCVRVNAPLSTRASLVLATVSFPTPSLNAWPPGAGVTAWVEDIDGAGWRVCAATTGAAYVPAFVAAYDLHIIAFGPTVRMRERAAPALVASCACVRSRPAARSPWPSASASSAIRRAG